MKPKPLSLQKRIAGVEIFWDEHAFREEYGHPQYLEMKPCHDELHQRAIDLFLANGVLVMERTKRPRSGLSDIASVYEQRPLAWPANRGLKRRRSNLLFIPLNSVERNWSTLRARAEPTDKDGSLWHDDPALVEKQRDSSELLCRTACVGHEGHVYYFVYPREPEWAASVAEHGFDHVGSGLEAYKLLVADGRLKLP